MSDFDAVAHTTNHANEPTIIAQGDGWIALNKPSGASIHSENNITGFIANAERQLDQKLWPVHRLDKVTSGILLVATSAEAAAHLSAQFADRTVGKYYLAVSARKPIKKPETAVGNSHAHSPTQPLLSL